MHGRYQQRRSTHSDLTCAVLTENSGISLAVAPLKTFFSSSHQWLLALDRMGDN